MAHKFHRVKVDHGEETYELDGVEYKVSAHSATEGGTHWRLLYLKAHEAPGFAHISREV